MSDSSGTRIQYRFGPERAGKGGMEFRLTYEGLLLSTRNLQQKVDQNGNVIPEPLESEKKAEHKHMLRKRFHSQLQKVWETRKPLNSLDALDRKWSERIAAQFDKNPPFRWAPLVRSSDRQNCALSILYLRRGVKGGIINGSDIDNKIKTVFDALKMPKPFELPSSAKPEADENPFFVLLEDDNLITQVTVETDDLLELTDKDLGDNDARLVITVRIWAD